MSYEEIKARDLAAAERIAAHIEKLSAAIDAKARTVEGREWFQRFTHGQPGLNTRKPCSVSYGWCFTHMDRAIKARPVGESVGPYTLQETFDAHPGPAWSASPYTIDSAFPHTLRRG